MIKRRYNLIFLILLTLILLCVINGISAVDNENMDLNHSLQFNDNLRINNINSSEIGDSNSNLTDNSYSSNFVNYQKENDEVSTVNYQLSSLNNGSGFENNEKVLMSNTLQNGVEDSNSIYISPSGTGTGTLENPSNWTYANENIPDGGTIYFTEGTYQLYNQSITKNLTVSSCNGEVIIDSGNSGCAFYILDSNNLFTVDGLTFHNGTGYGSDYPYDGTNIGYSGGSIFSKGTLVIRNSKFYDNNVKNFGGAIFSINNITVYNSSFINNYAYNMGSAVYSYNGSISVYDCEFINNTAIYSGVILAALGNLNVSGSTFINNSMKVSACAKGKYVTVNNSTFINNHAKYDGAVINANNGFNITNSVLINNTADNGAQALYTSSGVGYANYNWWGNNTPFNGTNYNSQIQIKSNFVKPDNWIIFSVNSVGNLIKPNLNYYTTGNNDYIFYGDGVIPERIVVFNDTENLNSTTTTSSSKYLGTNKNLTASTDNQSISFSLILGDKFYVNNSYNGNSTGTIDQPFNNLSYAVEVANNQNNNVILYIMNGVYNDVNMTITNNLTVSAYENSNVTLNALNKGFIFYCNDTENTVNIRGLIFVNGTGHLISNYQGDTNYYGGAIYTVSQLNLTNCKFINNTATTVGGAIFSNSQLNLTNCEFINNTLTSSGGYGGAIGIFGQSNITNILNSTFVNNTSLQFGGAVYSNAKILNINNSTFAHNSASNSGGAIYLENQITILNSTFLNNNAIYGGVLSNGNNVTVVSSVFINNSASDSAGVINSKNINMTYCALINNTAPIGQVIIYSKNDGSCIAEYNWWGNNTPFTDEGLISNWYLNENYDVIYANESLSNWVIMNLTTNNDTLDVGDNILLTVSLNTLNSTTGDISNLPSNISLPGRLVSFTSNYGIFNPNNENFTNNITSIYTATNTGSYNLSATVDNQVLSIPVTVNSKLEPKSTTITNDELTTTVNGTVIVYIIDDDVIVNTGSVNLIYNNSAIGTAYVNNGQANISIKGLSEGKYNVTVFYFGKEPFESTSKILTLTITPSITITIPNITSKPDSNNTITINITDNEGNPINTGNITVTLDDVNYTANVTNGSATVNYTSPNTIGLYNITVTYTNGTYSTSKTSTINVTNMTIDTVLIGNNLTKNYGVNANYTGKLLDIYGNPVIGQHIALNLTRLSDGKSKVYWVTTDTLGEYQLAINLSLGEYTAQASYYGNSNYSASNASVNSITVLNSNITSTVLTANNFLEPYGAGLNFTGKLTDNLGNPVIGQHIALNLTRLDTGASKIYWVTTDTLGEYQLAINLWTANYTAQCSYAGTSQYSSSSANATIKVTK